MARILVVDDDEDVCELLRQMLLRVGHEVATAADGRQAMMAHRRTPVDLVVLDIVMPEKEGLETIMELRQEDPRVKIIAISGGGRIGPREYTLAASKLGAHRTFRKPLDREPVLSAVAELLE